MLVAGRFVSVSSGPVHVVRWGFGSLADGSVHNTEAFAELVGMQPGALLPSTRRIPIAPYMLMFRFVVRLRILALISALRRLAFGT